MDLTIEKSSGHPLIDGFRSGVVSIQGSLVRESFLLLPGAAPTPWAISSPEELTAAAVRELFREEWDVLLIGTGSKMFLPDSTLLQTSAQGGRSIDFMTSRVACSTYNVLAMDDRAVAAAVILPI
jgi:uncharacterized protein